MATIVFNAPEGIADHINLALSDGRYIRLEEGMREYPDDVCYLLKMSRNQFIQRYIEAGIIDIRMDEASGLRSVLSSSTPFAPISGSDLGFIGSTGIATEGFGSRINGMSTPAPGAVITPTRTPGQEHQQFPDPAFGTNATINNLGSSNQANVPLTPQGENIAELNRAEQIRNSVSGSNAGQVMTNPSVRSQQPVNDPASLLRSTPSLEEQPTMPVSTPPVAPTATRKAPRKTTRK